MKLQDRIWISLNKNRFMQKKKKPELQVDDVIDDKLIRGTKSLIAIYQKCNMVVFELVGYDEVVKDPKWIATIMEEIEMIYKN